MRRFLRSRRHGAKPLHTQAIRALDPAAPRELLAALYDGLAFLPGIRRIVNAKKGRAGWMLEVWDRDTRSPAVLLGGHGDGHETRITAVAVTPDGRLCLSGDLNGRLRLWDLTAGISLGELRDHTRAIRALVLSPDGRVAATASDDRTIVLWDLERGTRVGLLEAHAAVVALACAPGALLSAESDGAVRVWDTRAHSLTRVLGPHHAPATALAVEQQGRVLVSGHRDGTGRGPALTLALARELITTVAHTRLAMENVDRGNIGDSFLGSRLARRDPYLVLGKMGG